MKEAKELQSHNKRLRCGSEARAEFPIFSAQGKDRPLAYLDSAASAQKPSVVIETIHRFLSSAYSNINRGAYGLSAEATDLYEEARKKIANFINAESSDNVIFVKGTTEAVNLVAHATEHMFKQGDVILLTLLEHHSNIVPWQLLAARAGLRIEFAEIDDAGELDLDDFKKKVKQYKPKLVSCTQLANSLGTVTPIVEMVNFAKENGAMVFVDGAQGICHLNTNVKHLGCDFYAFSAHKLYGPTGIGALYVTPDLIAKLEPFQGGGDMISLVTVEGSSWAMPPKKFEAGTPAIVEAIAFAEAINFFQRFDSEDLHQHERGLVAKAIERLLAEGDVEIYGPAVRGTGQQSSIVAFNLKGIHPHDLATVADSFNVQFRAGHHCAMPTLKRLGLPATARISFGVYSVLEDLDQLILALKEARRLFLAR